ncbi:MAG TPA: hypothetical protein VNF74_10750 [Terriglobales bacterium]|nr:hypothetical protein [Terriglobales bacterium]
MTHDDIERAINFLLKNQAEFDSRLAELASAQTQTERRLERTNEALIAVTGLLGTAADTLTQRMDQLATAQTEVAERLNAFIVIVEKYITRNGGGPH